MTELSIKIPKSLEGDKDMLEKKIGELVMSEAKHKELLGFANETMKGTKQLSDKKLVRFGRKLKKGRFGQLKKQGLI